MKRVLNAIEIANMEKLIKIVTALYKQNETLCQLEIDGKKESLEYRQAIKNIEIALDVEKSSLESILGGGGIVEAYIAYLMESCGNSDDLVENNLDAVKAHNYKDLVLKRILTTLAWYNISKGESFKKINEVPRELFKHLGVPDVDEMIRKSIELNVDVSIAVKEDVHWAFLIFLQEYIESKPDKFVQALLIRAKYNLSFRYRHIQEKMVTYNYGMPNPPLHDTNSILKYYDVDEEEIDFIKNMAVAKAVIDEMNDLINMSDADMWDISLVATSILKQIHMRSCLLLLSSDAIENLKTQFKEGINSLQFFLAHRDDKEGTRLIREAFEGIQRDSERVRKRNNE